MIARQIERVVDLPFASPARFVVVQAELPEARDMLTVAQEQHRGVLDAIEARRRARRGADARARAPGPAQPAQARCTSHDLQPVPGGALIRAAELT